MSPEEASLALWRNTGTLCVTATTMNPRQKLISCKQKKPVTNLFHRSKAKLDVQCKKKRREGQRWFRVESSCCKSNALSSVPRTHKRWREHEVHNIVLWPPGMCHMHTHVCARTQFKIMSVAFPWVHCCLAGIWLLCPWQGWGIKAEDSSSSEGLGSSLCCICDRCLITSGRAPPALCRPTQDFHKILKSKQM